MNTRLFPASAKQEKLHFVVANNGTLERFDGDPDLDYLEDIKRHMKRVFSGWDCKTSGPHFLQHTSPDRAQDFEKKFPFAIQRLEDKCYTRASMRNKEYATSGVVQSRNTPISSRPDVRGSTIVSNVRTNVNSDPRRSQEEIRLAQVSSQIKTVDRPISFKNLKLNLIIAEGGECQSRTSSAGSRKIYASSTSVH